MEKLLVEKGVYNALERLKINANFLLEDGQFDVNSALDFHIKRSWLHSLSELKELSASELARALLIGYELKPSPEGIIKDKLKEIDIDIFRYNEKGLKLKENYMLGFKDGIDFVLETYDIKLEEVN